MTTPAPVVFAAPRPGPVAFGGHPNAPVEFAAPRPGPVEFTH